MTEYAVRFSKRQRFEHVIVMTTFVLLALTGFPQKFFETGGRAGSSALSEGSTTCASSTASRASCSRS